MRYIILTLFLAGCTDQDYCSSDNGRSDIDYYNCHPKECQPSDYEPIDLGNL